MPQCRAIKRPGGMVTIGPKGCKVKPGNRNRSRKVVTDKQRCKITTLKGAKGIGNIGARIGPKGCSTRPNPNPKYKKTKTKTDKKRPTFVLKKKKRMDDATFRATFNRPARKTKAPSKRPTFVLKKKKRPTFVLKKKAPRNTQYSQDDPPPMDDPAFRATFNRPARKKKAPHKTLKTNTLKQAVDSYIKFTKIKASKTSFLQQVDAFSGKQADSFRMYLKKRKPTENMPARFQGYMDQFERKAVKVKKTKTARKRKQVLSKPSALRSGRSYT